MRIVDKAYDNAGREIEFNKLADDYLTYRPKYARRTFEKVKNGLQNISTTTPVEKDFIDYLVKEFDNIIKATPVRLKEIAENVDTKYPDLLYKNKKQTRFGKKIENEFAYKKFRSSSKAIWYGNRLRIKTCLYCNAQSTLLVQKSSRHKLLFQFDHFFSKSKYPFLSLSMSNLIPCCSNCNISKSKTDFTFNSAIHPYYEDINKMFVFYVEDDDVLNYLIKEQTSRKIKIKIRSADARVDKHVSSFSLESIYNEHTDFIEELFLKAYHYNSTKRKELIDEFKGIVDDNTIKRFILGNYYLDEELNKRPLAKMIKDISTQIKLLD